MLDSPLEWNRVLMLRPQALRVGQVKESLYWVNTRELDRELCTRWATLYTTT